MSDMPTGRIHYEREDTELSRLATLFSALDQSLLLLDQDFHILRVLGSWDWAAPQDQAEVEGRPVGEVLQAGLFGPGESLRQALEVGHRRHDWRGSTRLTEPPQLVSVSAAPLGEEAAAHFGIAEAAYAVVLRPVRAGLLTASTSPVVFAGMVARSAAMLRVFRLIENLTDSLSTVLISGESGTGKELVARALHGHSPRRDGPFVAVNCGALPENLLESELFGHARGAFTGAHRDRVGRFELAHGGTLFLDEVGDLPLHLQVKLLRVLQERSFERVGENRPRSCDARFITATHVDLKQAIEAGRFRQDLYYRLRVVSCPLPPLRQRPEDVEPLALHLLGQAGARHGRPFQLSAEALTALLRYGWPGNVRELENALEHAISVGRGEVLQVDDLPAEILEALHAAVALENSDATDPSAEIDCGIAMVEADAATLGLDAPQSRGPLDAERLRAALEAHQWQRQEAARALGISRTTLWRHMRRLGWVR